MIHFYSYQTMFGKYSIASGQPLPNPSITCIVRDDSKVEITPEPQSVWRFPERLKAKLISEQNDGNTQLKGDSVLVLALDPGADQLIRKLNEAAAQLDPVDGENLIYSVLDPRQLLKGSPVASQSSQMPELDYQRFVRPKRRLTIYLAPYARYLIPAVMLLTIVGVLGWLVATRDQSKAPDAEGTQVKSSPVTPNGDSTYEPWVKIQEDWQRKKARGSLAFQLAESHSFPSREGARERFALAAIKAALVKENAVILPADLARPGQVTSVLKALHAHSRLDEAITSFAASVFCPDSPPEDSELDAKERAELRSALLGEQDRSCKPEEQPTRKQIDDAVDAVKAMKLTQDPPQE